MIAPLDVDLAARLVPASLEDPYDAGEAAHEAVPLDAARVEHDLGPHGLLARGLAAYEDRPSQRAMAAAIVTLYNRGGVGLLEAGTGVGKSLGYLVPALRWAALNKQRTVVSTNTINLQEQLVRKDLPFLAAALGDTQPVRFALLKGWRNYLCKLRLEQARLLGPALLEDDVSESVAMIAEWAEETEDGSLSALPTPPRADVWDEVAAEPDLCTRTACPHFQSCFLFKARRVAAQADVVVVNHHLLMSDIAVRRAQGNWGDSAVIPPYTRVVIDEGHHLEDAAAAHLGSTITRRALLRQLARLDRRGRGLVAALIQRLADKPDLLSVASLDVVTQRIAPSVRAAREKAELLFDLLLALLKQSERPVLRLTDAFQAHAIWAAGLHLALTDVLRELKYLSESLILVRDRLENGAERDDTLLSVVNEIRGVARRLDGCADALRMGLRPPAGTEPHVRWIEIRGRDGNVGISSVPLDLAPILRDDLFARVKTSVVTSATLSANGEFAFLSQRLGLDVCQPAPVTATFPSPFDYPRQVLLALPSDVPSPADEMERHFRAVCRIVGDVAQASGGGIFVLFTSHRDVRNAAAALRENGFDTRFPLLVHGEDGRDALLSQFKAAGNAVLLGTASYWEGVDVPGDALRGLVIARLPFRVPTEPMTAAQCEAIVARGGDAFVEYMLPHASLRLKQGFGRLIRSAGDRGVVVIADPRAVSKKYGRDLVAGLPGAQRAVGRWRDLLGQVRGFYR